MIFHTIYLDSKKKDESRLPIGTVINSEVSDEVIAQAFENVSDFKLPNNLTTF